PIETERDDDAEPAPRKEKKGGSGFLSLLMLGLVGYGVWTFRAQLMTRATAYMDAQTSVAPVPSVGAVDAALGPIADSPDAEALSTITPPLADPADAGIADAASDADASDEEDLADDAGPAVPTHTTTPQHHPGKPRVPPHHRRPKK
ncbi:MAG: hypothetical protein ABIP39_08710, partial [Polyangiaceae bacterium]